MPTYQTQTNRLIRRAIFRRFVVAPAVTIGVTVAGVLIADALEKKFTSN